MLLVHSVFLITEKEAKVEEKEGGIQGGDRDLQ